jgi:transcriptional regulator with XRE-family HTH domain
MIKDDLSSLHTIILKEIRGDKSALALSKELGFSSNKYHRWESGHAKLYWDDFIFICKFSKNLNQKYFRDTTLYDGDLLDVAHLFKYFVGDNFIPDFLKSIKVSKATYTKWINKESSPSVETVFKMFHYGNRTISSLLPTFSTKSKSEIPQSLNNEEEKVSLWKRYPYLSIGHFFVMQNLDLDYHQMAGKMSSSLRIPINEVQHFILDLEFHGIIKKTPEGNYEPCEQNDQRFSLSHQPETLKTIIHAMSNFSFNQIYRLDEISDKSLRIGTTEIFVPKEGVDELIEIWVESYNKINALSKKYENTPPTTAKHFSFTSMLCKTNDQPVGPYFQKAKEFILDKSIKQNSNSQN